MTVSNNDGYPITPTNNPRAEIGTPPNIEPGEELWWSTKFFLPADFPTDVPGWLSLMEGPYGEPFNGSPPWHIEVNGTYIQWSRNQTYSYDVPWRGKLIRNHWITVTVHELFAPHGFVEMWINGHQVGFFTGNTYNPNRLPATARLETATVDASNDAGPNSIRLQSYRKAGMFPWVTVYEGPLRIGSTQASVQQPEHMSPHDSKMPQADTLNVSRRALNSRLKQRRWHQRKTHVTVTSWSGGTVGSSPFSSPPGQTITHCASDQARNIEVIGRVRRATAHRNITLVFLNSGEVRDVFRERWRAKGPGLFREGVFNEEGLLDGRWTLRVLQGKRVIGKSWVFLEADANC